MTDEQPALYALKRDNGSLADFRYEMNGGGLKSVMWGSWRPLVDRYGCTVVRVKVVEVEE